MVTTAPTLDTKHGPGIYHLETKLPVDEAARLLAHRGFEVFSIDGSAISDTETFLRAAGHAMGFPDYYGANWDAFEECITDLAWIPARGYVLLVAHVERFRQENPAQWETALEVLRAATEHWNRTDSPMYVLLRGIDSAASDLPVLRLG